MEPKQDIIITEFMNENSVDRMKKQFTTHYDPTLHSKDTELKNLLSSAVALIVRNQTVVDTELLESAPQLKVVGRLGVGLDNIDVEACAQRNIKVIPAAGANSIAVAEYVLATMLILSRGVFDRNKDIVSGKWPRAGSIGGEIGDKILGLVGFGDIAQRIAERSSALEMTVIAYDPFVAADSPLWKYSSKVELDELLAESDVISLHVPLTNDTKNMIGATELEKMKSNSILINTSRGGVVDESALIEALKQGQIAGAALDVYETEPVTEEVGKKFKDVPNLILTPHIAGVSHESNIRVGDVISAAIIEFLTESN